MNRLVLIAAAALALTGCAGASHIDDARIDFVCAQAVTTAHGVEDIAAIAELYGIRPADAHKIADAAANGADVVPLVCALAHIAL